ncbi:unnamed protein product [Paramecium sonneborni]|uniref:Uncharacterized protein n=1 Tax=Paramecium sonneborni TaxID=65129 RepID=A0A8S1LMF3_9CILI|nr:unnamed protein product [Paramecium sonneborni]CAD8068013.1 unnamed protein product [Paramecium sonneborni]
MLNKRIGNIQVEISIIKSIKSNKIRFKYYTYQQFLQNKVINRKSKNNILHLKI